MIGFGLFSIVEANVLFPRDPAKRVAEFTKRVSVNALNRSTDRLVYVRHAGYHWVQSRSSSSVGSIVNSAQRIDWDSTCLEIGDFYLYCRMLDVATHSWHAVLYRVGRLTHEVKSWKPPMSAVPLSPWKPPMSAVPLSPWKPPVSAVPLSPIWKHNRFE
jgi:hypothetical protein